MRKRSPHRPPVWKALLNGALAAGLVVFGFAGTPAAPAQAADTGADIGSQLTNVKFAMDPDTLELEASKAQAVFVALDACVPASGKGGDSWSIGLGKSFDRIPARFSITNPGDMEDIWIELSSNKDTGEVTYVLTESGAAQQSLCFNSKFEARYKASAELGEHEITGVDPAGNLQVLGTVNVTEGKAPIPQHPRTKPGKSFQLTDYTDQCQIKTSGCLRGIINLPAGNQGTLTIIDQAQGAWQFATGAEGVSPVLIKRVYDGKGKLTSNKAADKDEVASVMNVLTLTAENLEVTLNTSGLSELEEYSLQFLANAKHPNGGVPTLYANDASVRTDTEEWPVAHRVQSAFVGGGASGAHIKIVKKDESGADANTEADAAEIVDQQTGLVFTVMNFGDQPLTDIEVADEVLKGGQVKDLSCAFPDKTTGTQWAGPFEKGESFVCTAQLVGVTGAHHNIATVTSTGLGAPVTSSDPYFGQGTPPLDPATLTAPQVDAPECTVENAGKKTLERVTAPKNTESVTYGEVSIDDANVATMTATANAGFTFKNLKLGEGWKLNRNGTATWSQQLETKVCDSLGALEQPVVTAPECTVDTAGQTLWASVAAPADTDDISYGEVSVSDEKVATLAATPKPGVTLAGVELGTGWKLNSDGTATWSQQLESTVCDSLGSLAQPAVSIGECSLATAGETLWQTAIAPADTDDITYGEILVSADNVATLTATANPGFTLVGAKLAGGWTLGDDGSATWSHKLESKVCDALEAPAQPAVTVPECTADTAGDTLWPTVTAPADSAGISYGEVAVSEEQVASLTATVAAGYQLDPAARGTGWVLGEGGSVTWSQQLNSVLCASALVPGKPAPDTTPEIETTPETTPDPQGELAQSSDPLVATGGEVTGMVAAAAALLVLGLAATAIARRGRAEA